MCNAAIALTLKALGNVGNAEGLLKVKGSIALFIQTMDVGRDTVPLASSWSPPILTPSQGWGYSVSTLDSFLLALFDKYTELLKRRFSEDFQEVGIPSSSLARDAIINSLSP